MRLLLARHAQTDWNAQARYVSRTDRPLSEAGRRQAAALAGRLARLPAEERVEVVFSSPSSRALETAREVAAPQRLDVQVVPDLREIDFGDWEGLTYQEIDAAFPQFQDWLAAPAATPVPGGEGYDDFARRVASVMDDLLARPYVRVAVVSHAGWLKMMLGSALGIDRIVFGNLRIDHCALSVVETDTPGWRGKTRLITLNDTCHLGTGDD